MLNLYIKPAQPVVSYLTALTGLTEEMINTHGMPLEAALEILRRALPKNATLVGQSIGKDVAWLSLKEGEDFAGLIDLAGLYRVWNPKFKSWSMFGQDHMYKVLLPAIAPPDDAPHDAVGDAIKSVNLFGLYSQLVATGGWEQAQTALLEATPAPSFARRFPVYEGVCMGNKKECKCGAQFVFG